MRYVIVPVLTGIQMTREAIQSALAQDTGDVHVLAIDNGSTDGCGPYLRSLSPARVTVVTYTPSVSLHYVWNHAIDLAFSHGAPHVLTINNDVVLRPDCYRLLEEDGGGFVTGVGVNDRGQLIQMDVSARSPHPSFSCFLIRREVWEKVGKFDEAYWAWCGDADYHLRMDALSIDAYSIAVPFLHIGSATIKSLPHDEHVALCHLSDADRDTFARKWGCKVGSDEYYARFRVPPPNIYAQKGVLA